jgi:hypothetical protein
LPLALWPKGSELLEQLRGGLRDPWEQFRAAILHEQLDAGRIKYFLLEKVNRFKYLSARTSLRSNLASVGALEAMLVESMAVAYCRARRAPG